MGSIWRTVLFAGLAWFLLVSTLTAQTLTVKVPRENVRAGPARTYDVVGKVRQGEKYTVESRSGDWFKILLDSGAGRLDFSFAGGLLRERG